MLYRRGRRLPRPLCQKQAAHLRRAVPEPADKIPTEPGRHAPAATLADTEAVDHDPTALLAEAAGRRELHPADSISDDRVPLRRAG